jgi:hypothetical protein
MRIENYTYYILVQRYGWNKGKIELSQVSDMASMISHWMFLYETNK